MRMNRINTLVARMLVDPYRHKDYKNAMSSPYINAYLPAYAEGYRQVNR